MEWACVRNLTTSIRTLLHPVTLHYSDCVASNLQGKPLCWEGTGVYDHLADGYVCGVHVKTEKRPVYDVKSCLASCAKISITAVSAEAVNCLGKHIMPKLAVSH
jgi:hypothetical protein